MIEAVAVPRLYNHGRRVDDAVVLFHGFTNCPQQFDELARRFHTRNCNVYVPRIPLHGYKDRLTRALSDLDVASLQKSATDAYLFARGLGERVTVLGLSLGATMALWVAQTQAVDLAVAIAPFLTPIGFPRWLGDISMRALYALPDQYWWWDPRLKEKCRPPYAYPGYPTHALAECVFLGDAVFAEAGQPPRARNCIFVSNATESAVNNGVSRELLAQWRKDGATRYSEVVLTDLGAPRHDIIDPTTFPQARTLVYPKLEALVL